MRIGAPQYVGVEMRKTMAQNQTSKTETRGVVPSCCTDFVRELRVFEAKKESWLREHASHFVVIRGNTVAGFYPTYAQAYEAALRKFGFEQLFLIKQVMVEEQVFVVY
jgi:hypothetical protein